MTTVRRAAYAVSLADGRVFVLGDESEDTEFNVNTHAEIWDPTKRQWRKVEGLNKPRSQFAFVPLHDGRALVAGGLNEVNQSFSSTYVFDPGPGRETWSKAGLLGVGRTAPAAAVLPDGRVLAAGGFYRKESAESGMGAAQTVLAGYRPDPAPIAERSPVPLFDADPGLSGIALATAELFDPASGKWSATTPMRFARTGAQAVILSDGRILVVGSSQFYVTKLDPRAFETAELYDPRTAKFTLAGRLPQIDRAAIQKSGVSLPANDPEPATNGTLLPLKDGGAVLLGHRGSWKHQGEITRSFRFDPQTTHWTEIGQTCASVDDPTGRTAETGRDCRVNAMAAALQDGNVMVAGGESASRVLRSAQVYDPRTNVWSQISEMPEARTDGRAIVLTDGSVLLVGGHIWNSEGGAKGLSTTVRFVPAH